MIIRLLSIALISGMSSAACYEVAVEVPNACLSQQDVQFLSLLEDQFPDDPNNPTQLADIEVPEGAELEGDTEQSFVLDDFGELKDLLDHDGADANMVVLAATLRARSGFTDFSFLKRATLTLQTTDENSDLPVATIVACDAVDCGSESDAVTLSGNQQESVVEYIRTGSVQFNLAMGGALPLTNWSVDVEVCMEADASYSGSL